MSSVICCPHINIPKNPKSHTLGWTKIWSELLNADINHKCDEGIFKYNKIYIDHGVNFGGTLNLFGGATEEIYNKFNNLMEKGTATSLDIPMPDFGTMLAKRIGNKTTTPLINQVWCNRLSEFCRECDFIEQIDLLTLNKGLTLGDSHSLAFSKPNDIVLKRNGRTLSGALKKGIDTYLSKIPNTGKEMITLSLGSIDIRHHIIRKCDYKNHFKEMLDEYIRQVKEAENKYDVLIQIAAPVPVEYEGRRVPKTGWYEGTPFYGTQKERAELTKFFIDYMKHKHDFIQCPREWYEMDPEKYAKEVMELSSSVHISPTHYRRYGWGK